MADSDLKRLAGNYAAPRVPPVLPAWPGLGGLDRTRLAAVAAPRDFLMIDNVAGLLQERYAGVAWIRLGPADGDPGALLLTLLAALAWQAPDISAGIGEAVRRWSRQGDRASAYGLTGQALAAAVGRPAVMVLEGAEHLIRESPAQPDPVVPGLLPGPGEDLDVVLIAFAAWDPGRLGRRGQVLGPGQLRLDARGAALMAETIGVNLPDAAIRGGLSVTGGAAGALRAAFSASTVVGRAAFGAALAGAAGPGDLLTRLVRGMLARAREETRAALAGALRLGVWHRDLGAVLGHGPAGRDEPWWLELADGWRQLIPAWRAPLRSLEIAAALDPASLTVLADHLARRGAADIALDLYLEAGQTRRALDAAATLAGDLARGGCWSAITQLAQDMTAGHHPGRPRGQDAQPEATSMRFSSLA